MHRRDILLNACFVLGAAALAALTAAATEGPYQLWLLYSSGAFGLLSAAGLAWFFLKSKKEAMPVVGDNYNNSGNNFGHMGPVNIGKQAFNLTPEHLRQVVNACPAGVPVQVVAVGVQRAFPMQSALAAALEEAGFEVTLNSVAVLAPPPDRPLTVAINPGFTLVTIAPNA